jgi:diguanylate cyclase (GGDEF)-like protein
MSAVDVAAPNTVGAIWDDLVAELPVGVMLQDQHGGVLAANKRAASLLGLSQADLLCGRRPARWGLCDESGAALPSDADLADQAFRMGTPLAVPMVVTRDGKPRTRIWADHYPLSVHGRPRLLVLLAPVDDDVARSRGLIDPVTGLPGRLLLLDRLQQALVRARTHGTLATLVLLDVRQLATINARHGFVRGDDLLALLGGRLRSDLRADHTVARYGGDELAVVAEHPNGTGEPIAERVRDLAERPVRLGGAHLRPGVQVCWVTSDGSAPVHSVLAYAESRLRP